MSASNGLDLSPLAGWIIALLGARALIGRSNPDTGKLSPVYELQAVMGQTPDGRTATQHRCVPVMLLSGIAAVTIPSSVVLVHVDELSRDERRMLASAVRDCDELLRAMRAQSAGLISVPAGAKLPTPRS